MRDFPAHVLTRALPCPAHVSRPAHALALYLGASCGRPSRAAAGAHRTGPLPPWRFSLLLLPRAEEGENRGQNHTDAACPHLRAFKRPGFPRVRRTGNAHAD